MTAVAQTIAVESPGGAERTAGVDAVYWPALDGLRAFAVASVIGLHLGWLHGGYVGVNVFFVLSGFLITSLLIRERRTLGSISLRRFYARRALRLLPALLVMLVVVGVWSVTVAPAQYRHSTQVGVAASILYAANWIKALQISQLGVLGHTWTLSVEEQFYVLWPLIVTGALRFVRSPRHAATLCLVVAGGAAIERGILWHGPSSWYRVWHGTDTNALDFLLVGAAAAFVLPMIRPSRALKALGGAAIVFLAVVALVVREHDAFLYRGGFTLIALASALLIVQLLVAPLPAASRVLSSAPLAYVGRRSYGIYLWQSPIIFGLPGGHLAGGVVKSALTLAVASASYALVERPLLERRRRYRR